MKKILLGLLVVSLTACTLGTSNAPKEKVKEFLDKYKNQDSEVLSDLDESISSEYTGEYKERYKTIMVNQYKNMDYKITDEIVDGDTAIVTADITVYDYANAINSANTYLSEHEDEFMSKSTDETTKENETTSNGKGDTTTSNTDSSLDNDKFLDYKLGLLENVSDKKTYTIEFSLTKDKEKNTWNIESLSNSDIEKLHGLYEE